MDRDNLLNPSTANVSDTEQNSIKKDKLLEYAKEENINDDINETSN